MSDTGCAMNAWHRIPLRLRLTLLFVPGMAVLLAALAIVTVRQTGRDLLDTVDAGLRSRAEVVAAEVREYGPRLNNIRADLIESDEAFVQISDSTGAVVQSSAIVAGETLLPPATSRTLPEPSLFERRVAGIDGITRVLAVPVVRGTSRWVVAVGASLQDRQDQLASLTRTLEFAMPTGLLVVSVAGWLLVGAALRPVERMRAEASAIAVADLDGRLATGPARDELARLGETLNSMLDRVRQAVARERRLIDNASHELRTPLAILRTELDLALSRPRSNAELVDAQRRATRESDHLGSIADDLLVLSRARDGDLALRRQPTALSTLLDDTVRRHAPRAAAAGVEITFNATSDLADLDPTRMRQALDNLLDNAIRHTPPGGRVTARAGATAEHVRLDVIDTGCGFPSDLLDSVFEPFTRGGVQPGAGLGLAVVQAIATAHGGTAHASNSADGGAQVTITLARA